MNEQTTLPARARSEQPLPAIFGRLRDEIDHLFEDFTIARPVRGIFRLPSTALFSPVMEMIDKGDHYEVSLELPGMDEKAIDVECADGVLTVSGEKHGATEERSDGYLISERSYGGFRRQISLPPDVDPDAITAKYRAGVLKLALKKDEAAASRVRKIAVG